MAEKPKKKRTSRKKAGHTPMPHGGSTCGHSRCKTTCCVRYSGPTSHLFHHHSYTAARGIENIWLATVVAGLAILITGVVAYQAAQAQAEDRASEREQQLRGELIREIRSIR